MQDMLSVLRYFSAILFKFINQGISLTLCYIHCWKVLDVRINNTLAFYFLVISERLRILMTALDSNEGYISEWVIRNTWNLGRRTKYNQGRVNYSTWRKECNQLPWLKGLGIFKALSDFMFFAQLTEFGKVHEWIKLWQEANCSTRNTFGFTHLNGI